MLFHRKFCDSDGLCFSFCFLFVCLFVCFVLIHLMKGEGPFATLIVFPLTISIHSLLLCGTIPSWGRSNVPSLPTCCLPPALVLKFPMFHSFGLPLFSIVICLFVSMFMFFYRPFSYCIDYRRSERVGPFTRIFRADRNRNYARNLIFKSEVIICVFNVSETLWLINWVKYTAYSRRKNKTKQNKTKTKTKTKQIQMFSQLRNCHFCCILNK